MKNLSLCISLFAFLLCNNIMHCMDLAFNKKSNFYEIPRKLRKKESGAQKDNLNFFANHKFKKTPLVVNITREQRLAAQLQNLPIYNRLTTADVLLCLAKANPAPINTNNNID